MSKKPVSPLRQRLIDDITARRFSEHKPTRKRTRHKPKRYNRPVPGDRVQMDTCKIRPGLYQFTAIDDCSRFLVAGVARRRNAKIDSRFPGPGSRRDAVLNPADSN